MKRTILVGLMVFLFSGSAFAQSVGYLFVQKHDGPGMDQGDVLEVLPATAQYEPTSGELTPTWLSVCWTGNWVD